MRFSLSAATTSLWFLASRASAAVFDGPGLEGGVNEAALVNGPAHQTLRSLLLTFLYKVLFFLALAAVFVLVLGGFYLIISSGNETAKDRVKKLVLYVAIGLIIVLLARAGVGFLLNGLPN